MYFEATLAISLGSNRPPVSALASPPTIDFVSLCLRNAFGEEIGVMSCTMLFELRAADAYVLSMLVWAT
jgi:hypothetical protein